MNSNSMRNTKNPMAFISPADTLNIPNTTRDMKRKTIPMMMAKY